MFLMAVSEGLDEEIATQKMIERLEKSSESKSKSKKKEHRGRKTIREQK